MRCERMKATLSTSDCLRRQDEIERYVKTRKHYSNGLTMDVPNTPAHGCYKCAQGAEVKKSGGNDVDIEKIKDLVLDRIPEGSTRTCLKCHKAKELKQFYKHSAVCRSCSIIAGKARQREINKPKPEKYDKETHWPAEIQAPQSGFHAAPVAPGRTISIEISGQRIELCPECARKYLRI